MATTLDRPAPAPTGGDEPDGVRARVPEDTLGGIALQTTYTADDVADTAGRNAAERPGAWPYTRGIHQSGYRGKVWTMRQFAGFGSAAQTNARFHQLLAAGAPGLSVAFDMPTLMGHDSDDPRALGEVGHCGVAIDSVEDMHVLFDGIDPGAVTTSMTINSPASIALAQYIVTAEEKGVGLSRLGGTLQNDILKEYIAQKEFIYPPAPSMRLVADSIAFCARNVPRWHPVSISGYHIREAGATAVQELAFTLSDGFAYVEAGMAAGLDVDEFAPRLSFFFDAHIDFFEEVCKLRAARRIWARHLRERYGARDERSWKLKFHTQTAGVSLTAQQIENNVARTAIEALAAVLGGTNSLHTNSMDEVLALPTDKAAQIALRTQQVIAYETGAGSVADPLAGSYFVEALTDEIERQCEEYFAQIERRGGVLAAISEGYQQSEIAEAAFRFQQQLESGERVIVSVNAFTEDVAAAEQPQILRIDQDVERQQVAALRRLRETRDNGTTRRRLEELQEVARGEENTMPAIIECVRARATEGEIVEALRAVFGTYRETPAF